MSERSFVRAWTSSAFGGIELLLGHYRAFKHPKHFHEFDVLGVVEQGDSFCWFRGQRHSVSPGQIVYIPAGEVHTGEKETDDIQIYRSFYLPPGLVRMEFGVHTAPDLARRLANVHADLLRERKPLVGEQRLGEVLAELSQGPAARARPRLPKPIRRSLRALHDDSRPLSGLDELAAIAGLSPFHFIGVFKKSVGITPHQYIISRRVALARRLLLEGVPAGEVAAETGFSDQSHLTRVFRKFVGTTPAQFPDFV